MKDAEELSRRTKVLYESALARAYGKRAPNAAPDVRSWPESQRAILRAAIHSYWHLHGDRERGYAIAKRIPRTQRRKRQTVWPTLAEADAFKQAALSDAASPFCSVYQFMLRFGLRSEEAFAMPRAVVVRAQLGRLHVVGKGNKERVLPSRTSRRLIDQLLARPGADGGEWSLLGEILIATKSVDTQRIAMTRWMKTIAEAAGLDPVIWHPHTLRHVFAARFLRDGGSAREAQLALGHDRLETLAVYTHPTTDDLERSMRGDE